MHENKYKRFPQISPAAWEHPADRGTLNNLRRLPGVNELLKFFLKHTSDKSLRMFYLASSIRISANQFPRIFRLLQNACDILDAPYLPELYVTQNPLLNASCVGVNKPFLVLHSATISDMDDSELFAIIGHELGHLLSGHALYKTLLGFLIELGTRLIALPIGTVALIPILLALREWDRKSELSADRAGLLVVQDPAIMYNVFLKMAGGSFYEDADLEEFSAQARSYEEDGDVMDSLFKIVNLLGETHPFPALRLPEMKKWIESGAYEKFLGGNYTRRSTSNDNFFKDTWNFVRSYQKDFEESKDPLAKAANEFMEKTSQAAKDVEKFLTSFFRKY